MPGPNTLIVVHYHLLPGGVCSAIRLSLAALAQSGWFSERSLRLLVGRSDGVGDFTASLEPWDMQVDVEVDPRLDYSDRPWSAGETFWSEASALATWFLEQARGDTLYWAHNPTLGKNPLVTAALMTAAQEAEAANAPHRFLYHLHDFAECGRLQNLMSLRRCWGSGGLEEFYPRGQNVGYAVLNSADAKRLTQVGVPLARVFQLPNAVQPVRDQQEQTKQGIAPWLEGYAREHGYRFEPGRPWWTLPIRLIRRKNVVEALFLAAIAAESPQLLVTLDANSEPERPYAETVKNLVRRHQHPTVVGFGHELVGRAFGFNDLLRASDVVVSTSLMEGFGFAFLEGPNRGRPLLGRNLADVTEDFIGAGFPADSLYDRFLVPLDREDRERLNSRGRTFARKYGQLLGLSQSRVDAFIAELEELFSEGVVDFGYMDLELQVALAGRLGEAQFVRELQALNPGAAEPVEFADHFPEQIGERFGMRPHAVRLAVAVESLFTQHCQQQVPADLSGRLLDLYFSPGYHRPLTGGW